MSNINSNDKNNADAKQPKSRVLRAKDIIPGAPKNNPGKPEQAADIPTFDLAEQILAQQRKITAIRRKAPGQKAEAPTLQQKARPIDYIIERPTTTPPKHERLIAEIVAGDIEKLCRYNTSRR